MSAPGEEAFKLTPYQLKLYSEYATRAHRAVVSTTETDRSAAEGAIRELRSRRGDKPGAPIIWFESPKKALSYLLQSIADPSLPQYGRMSAFGDDHTIEVKLYQDVYLKRHKLLHEVKDAFYRQTSVRADNRSREQHALRSNLYANIANVIINQARHELYNQHTESRSTGRSDIIQYLGSGSFNQTQAPEIFNNLFIRDILHQNVSLFDGPLDSLYNLVSNVSFCWNFETATLVCPHPTHIKFDDSFRLHCSNGPAIRFDDAFRVYSIHGVIVERHIVEDPSKITTDQIEFERNIEVRRVLIDLYGTERWLRETGAEIVHRGKYGRRLWQRPPTPWERENLARPEPLAMVEVQNSTAEPDGSYKTYFLRVSPKIKDADEAIASTFGLTKEQYDPQKET